MFDFIIFASVVGTIISIAIRGSGRIRYNDMNLDKEERKKAEARGQKVPKAKDILSLRFGEDRKKGLFQGNSDDEDSDEQ